MRDIEAPERFDILKKTDEEEQEYTRLRKNVENTEEMKKDVNNSILASMLYRRYFKSFGSKFRRVRGGGKSSMNIRDIVYLALGVLTLAFLIFQVFRWESGGGSGGSRSDDKAGKPTFTDGSAYANESYFGKENLFIQVISQMTKMVNLMRTLSDKELHNSIETTQRNFLFHGPPGTGKTLFMRRLAYLIDMNLKFLFMKGEMGDAKFEAMDFNERTLKAKSMKSLARITLVTPSSLNNKYVGETEKNIRNLFSTAESDSNYWVSIIFIDEVDVFFSKRSDKSQDYSLKSQTEFLNIIGGACDRLKSPVFLFGATNLYDTLDDAFKRRFSGVYDFALPTDNERLEILEQYLSECGREIVTRYNELVRLTNGMSQAKIVDILKKLAFSHDGRMKELKWKELRKAVEDAAPSKKGAEGNKVSVAKALRSFYFLEPKLKHHNRRG